MHCPFCRSEETKVIDSRLASEGYQVRRRRECLDCNERFTTFESAERNLPRVVKHDGRREPFNEEKLRKGIILACEKRPVATELIDASINLISRKALGVGEREIPAKVIGEWVMQELRSLDQVAYVRFASVYMSFEDVQAFKDIIDRVENDLTPEMLKSQLSLIADDADKKTH
ncbi:MAG: transcriptional regulator NrdR [Gammaproteobacteria bacterium]|nr:MAG: transcriptional regulator NrdR [Gammaproteobacteria bacterium]